MLRTLIILILFSTYVKAQSLYRSDYVETFDSDWSGVWWDYPFSTTGYFTDFWVSSNTSATIYGLTEIDPFTGTNIYESDWYTFPNLIVDPTYDYEFSFRLASYKISNPSAAPAGVDAGDYVTVQLSTDGGANYVNELRITGNNNANWNYNSASYTKTASGSLTVVGPTAGGNRTSTGDGYSVIKLKIPPGTTQIAIDVFARVNSDGEEWWMDNFELRRTLSALPVELSLFSAIGKEKYNSIKWKTESEKNSDYFKLNRSLDGVNWASISNIKASGFSSTSKEYESVDWQIKDSIVYYTLSQYDFNGDSKTYGPIQLIRKPLSLKLIKTINILGCEATKEETGMFINIYEDGHTEKIFKY